MNVSLNINSEIVVKLTEKGREILGKEEMEKLTKNGYLNEDELTMQLWELMSTFGNHLYNGCIIPFETSITIKSEDLHKIKQKNNEPKM